MTPHIHVVCSSIIYPLLEGSIINLYSFSKRTKERNHSFFLKKRTKRNGSCPLGRFLQPKRKCKEKSRKQGVDDVFACNFAFGNSVARSFQRVKLAGCSFLLHKYIDRVSLYLGTKIPSSQHKCVLCSLAEDQYTFQLLAGKDGRL